MASSSSLINPLMLCPSSSLTSSSTATLSLCLFYACLSGFAYGYDLSVISAVLPDITLHYNLTSTTKSLVVTLFSIGMLLGRLTGGILQDTFGRRIGLAIADIFIIISVSLTWALAPIYYILLLICRLILGIGISLALLIGCTYLSEISPPKWRGRMVTCHELSVCIGSLIGFTTTAFTNKEVLTPWALIIGVAVFPALLQLLLTYFLPESPRWLITIANTCNNINDKDKMIIQFNNVIKRLGYSIEDDEIKNMINSTTEDDDDEEDGRRTVDDDEDRIIKSSWLDRFIYCIKYNKKALILTIIVCGTASACGFYAFQSYAADVISLLTDRSIQYVQVHYLPYVGLMKLFGTIVALLLIDGTRMGHRRRGGGGRRKLLLTSIIGIAICEGILAILLQIVNSSSANTIIPEGVAITLFYLVIFFWSLGLGPILLMAANEYMPTYTRGVGNSIALTITSIFEIAYQQTFESMLYSSPSPSLPFFIYSITSLLSFLVLFKLLPETKGLTLEDASSDAIISVKKQEGQNDDDEQQQEEEIGLIDRIKKVFGCKGEKGEEERKE